MITRRCVRCLSQEHQSAQRLHRARTRRSWRRTPRRASCPRRSYRRRRPPCTQARPKRRSRQRRYPPHPSAHAARSSTTPFQTRPAPATTAAARSLRRRNVSPISTRLCSPRASPRTGSGSTALSRASRTSSVAADSGRAPPGRLRVAHPVLSSGGARARGRFTMRSTRPRRARAGRRRGGDDHALMRECA